MDLHRTIGNVVGDAAHNVVSEAEVAEEALEDAQAGYDGHGRI